MNLKYRNQRNAEAAAKYWNKPLDRPDWYRIEASSSDDAAEVIIYDAIGWPFNDAGEFVRAVSAIDARQLIVRINSPGGDVFDAMAIYNALRSHKSRVITRIESLAASAASFVVLAGKEVQAYPNAMMMIHEPWVVAVGTSTICATSRTCWRRSIDMVDVYAQNSNRGSGRCAICSALKLGLPRARRRNADSSIRFSTAREPKRNSIFPCSVVFQTAFTPNDAAGN